MFELPEYLTIARQMNESISGRKVLSGVMGNSPHKFVWYNREPEEFARLVEDRTVGRARARGRWLFLPLEPGYVLVFGECGGRIVLVDSGDVPEKYHLRIDLDDGRSVYARTQMWGAMELFGQGDEADRQYIRDMRPSPVEEGFTSGYLAQLVRESTTGAGRSVKSLLTQDQLIPGLGNSIAQDIMFRSKLHPKTDAGLLDRDEIGALHAAIVGTVKDVAAGGGRNDECDFFGRPGGYRRILDSRSVDRGCPVCDGKIEKIQYLGGSSYFCGSCQVLRR